MSIFAECEHQEISDLSASALIHLPILQSVLGLPIPVLVVLWLGITWL